MNPPSPAFSGVKGSARGRTPSAWWMPPAMAAMVGAMLASPAPRKGWSGRAMMSTATFGTSEKRRIGKPSQLSLVTRRRSKRTSSSSATEVPWMAPPSNWLATPSGFTTSPTSPAIQSRRQKTRSRASTSATTAAQAPVFL